jgi:hypothetical protein
VKNGRWAGVLGASVRDGGFPGAPPVEPESGGESPLSSDGSRRRDWVRAERDRIGAFVEVVGEAFLGGLFCFRAGGPHVEFGLRRSPGGMGERGRYPVSAVLPPLAGEAGPRGFLGGKDRDWGAEPPGRYPLGSGRWMAPEET